MSSQAPTSAVAAVDATAEDLYGDLDVEPVQEDDGSAQRAHDALLKEVEQLREENTRLKTEARVWAAQRAVLVKNLGALYKTAEAQEQRREREIRELKARLKELE